MATVRHSRYKYWLGTMKQSLEHKLEGVYQPSGHKERVAELPPKERAARHTLFRIFINRLHNYIHGPEPTHGQEFLQVPEGGFRTQKAAGVMHRTTKSIPGVKSDLTHEAKVLPYEFVEFAPVRPSAPNKMFARPCPTRPRHGFVESRSVHSYTDLLKIYTEALEQDPDAEVIVMPRLTGEFSGVATNAGVTWGLGHDGVTDGKGGVFIPANVDASTWNHNTVGYPETIGIKNVAYLELVHDRNQYGENMTCIVQRRDGPAQSTEKEYIPREVTVKKILRTHKVSGLLEWEKYIKENANVEGAVVWSSVLPLSSHYAVHAIEHGIPVLTRNHQPEIGEKIVPTGKVVAPLTKEDTKKIAGYINTWTRTKVPTKSEANISPLILSTAIATIHSMSRWDNSQHLLNLRAFGVTMLARYLHSALAGELRHWDRHGPGTIVDDETGERGEADRSPRTKIKRDKRISDDRLAVYVHYLKALSLRKRLESLNTIYEDFGESGWDGQYGGKNWQNVARVTASLVQALLEFLDKPEPKQWSNVAVAANTALHTAHNNGLAVTKWVAGHFVSRLAETPTLGFLNPVAALLALGKGLDGKVVSSDDMDYDDIEEDNRTYQAA